MPDELDNEPMSALTHLFGALLSIAGLSLLIVVAALKGGAMHVVTFTIFGSTMLLLYLTSTLYHFISKTNVRAKQLFRILDHSAIYLLIAGTYTPVALIVLPPGWGWTIFGLVWFFAILGTVLKATRMPLPVWISVALYLVMGWLIVIAFLPLVQSLEAEALFWLVIGGVCYSLGTIFYALDAKVPRTRWFGMHEIFHVFVMLGSIAHFWVMYAYVAHTP